MPTKSKLNSKTDCPEKNAAQLSKKRTAAAKQAAAQSANARQRFIIETEDTITLGRRNYDGYWRDRFNVSRDKFLQDIIKSWRTNPITRRLGEITTEFVIGDGFSFKSKHARFNSFISEFWADNLNNLDEQIEEWADEAWRTGDLFLLFSVDKSSGMSYVRAVPAELISEIKTANNDYRQETEYVRGALDEHPYQAYKADDEQDHFVLHFPLNRMVGCTFGESDFSCVLYWINFYQQWLEDRARLNYFRSLFSYIVQKPFKNPKEKEEFTNQVAARQPNSGSILVVDPEEHWGTLAPNLASFEGGEDGLALKRMPAVGTGTPMHYLAEPESSTSTTAEHAGMPAFKRFKRRQNYMKRVVTRVISVAIAVRRKRDTRLPVHPQFDVTAPDITQKDNANLALATQRIAEALAPILNSGLIKPDEFIRLVYRFLDEAPPTDIPPFLRPIVSKPSSNGTASQPGEEVEEKECANA